MTSIKARPSTPSNAVTALKAQLTSMESGGLTIEEARKLKDAFKSLSDSDKSAAVDMVRKSGYSNLAEHLVAPDTTGTAAGISTRDGGKPTASGPISAAAWKNPGPEILGKLTQNPPPGAKSAESGSSRCGPSNILAGAIMNGPDATAKMLTNAATNAGNQLGAADRARLKDIAGHVKSGATSFEELSEAQGLLYRAGNTGMELREAIERAGPGIAKLPKADQARFNALNSKLEHDGLEKPEVDELGGLISKATGLKTEIVEDGANWGVKITEDRIKAGQAGAFTDGEVRNLARAGGVLTTGKVTELNTSYDSETQQVSTLSDLIGKLGNGESATFRVGATDNSPEAHHYISVGRDPSGRPWIYNPDPVKGDATFHAGSAGKVQPDDFLAELERYSSRNQGVDGRNSTVITLKAP